MKLQYIHEFTNTFYKCIRRTTNDVYTQCVCKELQTIYTHCVCRRTSVSKGLKVPLHDLEVPSPLDRYELESVELLPRLGVCVCVYLHV
jgi:hypothetical protein